MTGNMLNRQAIAGYQKLWHHFSMRKRCLHRWSVMLGLLAMFGTVVAMPFATTYAFAMANKLTAMSDNIPATASHEDLPCHQAEKPHPHCPQKICPEMGTCLVKLFQPLPAPVGETRLDQRAMNDGVPPALARLTASSRVPLLLRPPSV